MTERFTLLSELGRGGMGVVWKARDEDTGRIVALKLLHAAFAIDPDYVARFERELELARRIHSAHTVGVLGYGVRAGTPYLALEYVDGPSLRERLAGHGPYSWEETRALLAQITQGLADAHAAGVIHRDIKPSNVLIGSDGVAKLADFGIAKGFDLTRVTGTSTLLGTPAYLAPEGPVDERSDLYSVGIIAYELLTGDAPFTGSTYQEVIIRHIREAPDLSKLPEPARPVVGRLLAKDPQDRPQRASALLPILYGAAGAPAEVSTRAEVVEPRTRLEPDIAVAPAQAPPAPAAHVIDVSGSSPSKTLEPAVTRPRSVVDPRSAVRPRRRGGGTAIAIAGSLALVVVIAAALSLMGGKPTSSIAPSASELAPTASEIPNASARPSASVMITSSARPSAANPAVRASGSATVGSYVSDPSEMPGFKAMMDYCQQQTGVHPTINTVDRGTFQNSISTYLAGTPDDVFTWFGGYRMRSFAGKGLAMDMSDVWANVGDQFSSAYKTAATADDGNQYLLPLDSYPWVMIYRKSVFAARGYEVPKTIAEFVSLAKKMQSDGLVPVAFGNKDGWPAMAIFDILDMRLNGYDFHMRLLAGKEKWTDPRVKAVFQTWAGLTPYFQSGAAGRVWQDAMQALVTKKAGMYFMGTFAATSGLDQATTDDLAFFPFPVFGNQFDSEMAIDAPIDGLMLSKSPKNLTGDKALLQCLATGPAQLAYARVNSGNVAANRNVDTSSYSDLQMQIATIISGSSKLGQYFDRDTRPDFAGSNGMQRFLATFLNKPTLNLDTYLASIQHFWDALPAWAG